MRTKTNIEMENFKCRAREVRMREERRKRQECSDDEPISFVNISFKDKPAKE